MRRFLISMTLAAVTAALLAGPVSAQTESEDLQEFCRARLALEEAFIAEDFDTAEEATTVLVESAPAAVADAAGVIAQLVASGDPDAFESEEAQQAQETIDSYVISNCGFRVVPVNGVDYAFEDVPKVIEAGIVAFQFANLAEEEEHELLIFRIKKGVKTPAKKLLRLPEDEIEDKIQFASAAFAGPGDTEVTITDLQPGRYIAACFVPVDGKEGKKEHWKRGMYATFRVTAT